MNKSASKIKGFNLIELMIVLAIIALLTYMALPNYQSYVMKSRRSGAISALLSIQLAEEKYRTTNANYGTLAAIWGGVTTTEGGYYALTITNLSATSYTVTATPQALGGQNNDAERGTGCNPMVLTVNGAVTTKTPDACWIK